MAVGPRRLTWVRGHTGVQGNEEADRKANLAAYGGRVTGKPDKIMEASIRQEYLITDDPRPSSTLRGTAKV